MPNQHHHRTFRLAGLWMPPSKLSGMPILAHDWKPLTDIAWGIVQAINARPRQILIGDPHAW